MKNPFPPESPEWQLYEIMESARALARACAGDADRAQENSRKAREKADVFEAALKKLTG
jgi:hypothetical protein